MPELLKKEIARGTRNNTAASQERQDSGNRTQKKQDSVSAEGRPNRVCRSRSRFPSRRAAEGESKGCPLVER